MVTVWMANCSIIDRLGAGWRRREKEKNKQEIRGRKILYILCWGLGYLGLLSLLIMSQEIL